MCIICSVVNCVLVPWLLPLLVNYPIQHRWRFSLSISLPPLEYWFNHCTKNLVQTTGLPIYQLTPIFWGRCHWTPGARRSILCTTVFHYKSLINYVSVAILLCPFLYFVYFLLQACNCISCFFFHKKNTENKCNYFNVKMDRYINVK